jgi:thiol:disulfide interchange protein/DsbC/DsbD-like thiol-disulfide interchange protein
MKGGQCATFFVLKKGWRHTMRRIALITGIVLIPALAGAGDFRGSAQRGGADAHTRIALLADVQAIQPGAPFAVGVLMTMDPGWHTYWKNPGESGLATSIRWTLPEGFTVGPTEWPLPEKKIEEGDVLTYGYGGETMLLATIHPPSTLAPGSKVTLRVDADWLECEKTCVPGSGMGELTLGVSVSASGRANQVIFDRYAKAVPKLWSESAGFTLVSGGDAGVMDVRLIPTGDARFVVEGRDAPDFYPEPVESLSVGRVQVNALPTDVRFTIPVKVHGMVAGARSVSGVVVYRLEGGERQGVVVRLPLSAALVSGLGAKSGSGVLDRQFLFAETKGETESLGIYLLFAVLGGLLLNIMPCVLPVIALKVFGLVRMAGDRPVQVRKLGWFFSLGILVSFVVLALAVVLLKIAGQQVGWGFQFQEPLFVMAMCAVVFAFGLSLFGVYEIRLPGAAVSGVSGAISRSTGEGRGYAASFSEGVFATILATPCTAPFLGSALGFAFSQPWWVIFLIFIAVAFGMALPYLILTTRPAWMKFLPRPGAWMESAKQFMGFLMMATLLWLLYILGKQLGMEAVVWTGAFLLTVGIACWMIGRFATLTASRGVSLATWSLALLVVVLGYLFFADPILRARSLLESRGEVSGSVGGRETDRIAWEEFSLDGLESRLNAQKPVFLDFTAEWCLTCKVNEKTVLSDRDVVAALRSAGMVAIRADWTNRNPDIGKLLSKFGRSGVPLYVIFPAGRASQPIVLPEVITPGIVLEAIAKAR